MYVKVCRSLPLDELLGERVGAEAATEHGAIELLHNIGQKDLIVVKNEVASVIDRHWSNGQACQMRVGGGEVPIPAPVPVLALSGGGRVAAAILTGQGKFKTQQRCTDNRGSAGTKFTNECGITSCGSLYILGERSVCR